jgi:hypothetical protein
LISQYDVKSKFMGPQNHHEGNHPDAMIKDLRALLNNAPYAMQHMVKFCGPRKFINDKSRNNAYISDEQLQALELCVYHGIKVAVEGLDGECTSPMCQCTGSLSWPREDGQNDKLWVEQPPGRCHSAQNRCLWWQPQA